MATGPEHYRLAEQLLDEQAEEAAHRGDTEIEAVSVAHAQVHATLALAAATADLFALAGQTGDVSKEAWKQALQ